MSRFSLEPRGLRRPANERGFVLVGVVMFVLALTILGLSLFALSSFEAQFQTSSYLSGQAFNVAQGGVEHAKFVLARRKKLQDVGTSLYPIGPGPGDGIIYARAKLPNPPLGWSGPDTVGDIENLPANTPIEIRVLANLNGERRMVESSFTIDQTPPLYKRLMSITDSLYTRGDASILPRNTLSACGNYSFTGEIWEGGKAGQGWRNCAQGDPSSWVSGAALPTPDVQSFITRHQIDAQPVDRTGNHIDLRGGPPPPTVSYYQTLNGDERTPPLTSFYVDLPGSLTIRVDGWVVWMLPQGFRSNRNVIVQGTSQDCLVIVAGESTDPDVPYPQLLPPLIGPPIKYDYLGITFSAGIESPDVPVILVTDGWVFDEHWFFIDPDIDNTIRVNYLSVFARAASYWGPHVGRMDLRHTIGDPRDAPGGMIDQLCDRDALPNSESGGIKLTPVAGTWRELNPDNPPN